MKRLIRGFCAVFLAVSASGCAINPNDYAKRIGGVVKFKDGRDLRALQTRRFDTLDERRLLQACTQVLQDLGFVISESSLEAGVVTGTKDRDATESGQVAGQVAVGLLMALMGSVHNPTYDSKQKIVVSVVTNPVKNSKQIEVRASFDRRLTNNQGVQWRSQYLVKPEIYQEFFEKVSEGVFLEAHKI